MSFFGAVLTILAIGLGLALLVPVVGVALGILFALGCVLLWVLPIVLIATSDKTTPAEKVLWILAIIFLSWFAWILYFFFAPLLGSPERHRYY